MLREAKKFAPALKKSLSWGGGGGGGLRHIFFRLQKNLNINFHNGVGVVSPWPWLTTRLTSAKKKKKKKNIGGPLPPPPPAPWRRHWGVVITAFMNFQCALSNLLYRKTEQSTIKIKLQIFGKAFNVLNFGNAHPCETDQFHFELSLSSWVHLYLSLTRKLISFTKPKSKEYKQWHICI